MARVFIGFNNRSDTATFAGGSWTNLAYLADQRLGKSALSATCKRSDTRWRCSMAANKTLRAFALGYHNLSSKAKFRLRAGRASLDLLFDSEQSDINDTRLTKGGGTNGTRVNSRGRIVPVTRTNVVLRSQEFDNAVWTKMDGTAVAANVGVAPDGTTTADLFTPSVSNAGHFLFQAVTVVAGANTLSVYVKPNGYTKFAIGWGSLGTVWFDLTGDGAVLSGNYSGYDARIEKVQGGWYRISQTGVLAAGAVTVYLQPAIVDGSSTFAGDGTSGWYLWGCQGELSADATDYIATTSATVTATSSGRINYGARRENLALYSEQFDNAAWTKGPATVTANTTTAPDGQTTADTLTSSGGLNCYQPYTNSSLKTFTFSCYLKAAASSSVEVYLFKSGIAFIAEATFSLTGTGSITAQPFGSGARIVAIGGGWYRCSVTGSYDGNITFGIYNAATSVYAWGAQLELGVTTPGYYLPTTTAACVDLAPWRTNLIPNSNTINASTYTASNASLWANEFVAGPVGAFTKLVEDATTNIHYTSQSFVATTGTPVVYSVHLKAAGRTSVLIALTDEVTGNAEATVNLTSGTISLTTTLGIGQWTNTACGITSLGDGAYRAWVRGTVGATGTHATPQVLLLNGAGSYNYAGDGASGVYVSGFQVERYIEATPYIATTTQARTVADECLGLLVEEARTNLLVRSSELDNGSWVSDHGITTANSILAPDGTLTADKFTENTDVGVHHKWQQGTVAVSASTRYTMSAWVHAGSRTQTWVGILDNSSGAGFTYALADLVTGTILTTTGSGATSAIEYWGNGWYRLSYSLTMVGGTTNCYVAVGAGNGAGSVTYSGSGTDYIYGWGAQLEAGSFPTSYIPTTSAAVTRAADVAYISGASFTSFHNQAANTLYVEAASVGFLPTSMAYASLASSTNTTYYHGVYTNGAATVQVESWSGSTQASHGAVATTAGTYVRGAIAHSSVEAAMSINGDLVQDTSFAAFAADQLRLHALSADGAFQGNCHIKRVTYFPERLKNSELVTLTTSGPDALGFNSGWVNALQMTFQGDMPSDWGHSYDAALCFSAVNAQYTVVEIDDTTNTNGSLSIGRQGLMSGLQPQINPNYGDLNTSVQDLSLVDEMTLGRITGTDRGRRRLEHLVLKELSKDEALLKHEMDMFSGKLGEVLYIPDPDDMAVSQRRGGLGHLRELSVIEYPVFEKNSLAVEWMQARP